MGEKDILFLRNHGIIVAARPWPSSTISTTRACGDGAGAAMPDRPALHNIDEATGRAHRHQIAGEAQQALLHFESLKRMLDRDEPGWRKLAA